MKKRLQAIEKRLNISGGEPPCIVIRFVSTLAEEPLNCLGDGSGRKWYREPDESEESFTARARREYKAKGGRYIPIFFME